MRRGVGIAAIAVVASGLGCRGVPNALGPDRQTARTNADGFFDGLAKRFDAVQRAPKFAHARSKLGRYALSPSGVYGDTSVWTAFRPDSTRTLSLYGSHTSTGYLFATRATVPVPAVAGDARHIIQLRRRGESEYEWQTNVDHGIGSVRVDTLTT